MKHKNLFGTTVAFLVFAGSAGRAQTAQGNTLEVKFSAADSAPTLREPVYIDLTIRNHTGRALQVDLGHDTKANFEFSIGTPGGATVRPPRMLRGGIGRVGQVLVGSGQTYQQKILLNEWYQFQVPGNYVVEAKLVGNVGPLDGALVKSEWSAQIPLHILPHNPERLRSVCEELTEAAVRPDSSEVALKAALTLSQVIDPVAVPYLERVLKESHFAKIRAIEGLARIGNSEALRILRSAMIYADPELKAQIQYRLSTRQMPRD
jgi:hypothetical protein